MDPRRALVQAHGVQGPGDHRQQQPEIAPIQAQPGQHPHGAGDRGILIVGVGKLLTQLARCCKPAPPDPIQGFITRGKGVSIHRADCSNFANLMALHPERVIEAEWGQQPEGQFPVDIVVDAQDRQGLLRDISDVFAREKINVIGVNTVSKQGQAHMAV